MEPYKHNSESLDDAYSCQDYYSTGGYYRPPKTPKNHGWLVAVLGVLLLCFTGGMVVLRGSGAAGRTDTPPSAQDTVYETMTAENASDPNAGGTGEETQPAVLGSGTVLSISESSGEQLSFQEIYKKMIPSVVSITATSQSAVSTGTGIIMSSDGYIITNYHVVSDAQQVTVLLSNSEEYTASQVGGDETSDLMVLKIEAENLTPAEFGDSEAVEVGDSVLAIGDPLGVELRGTMTNGIICGINRDVSVGDRTMTLMQTNAALNSGNSGGPLVNMAGQVIGINTMKLTSSNYTTVEGLGFAIPISTAKPIIDELTEKGYVTGRPALGFTVEMLDSRIVLFYNLPGRLMIRSVEPNSDACAKGVEAGDIIVAINDVTVSTTDEFNRVKNEYAAGDQVTLTLYRDRESYQVTVTLMDCAELN